MNKQRALFAAVAPFLAAAGFGLSATLEQGPIVQRLPFLTAEQARILSHMSLVDLDDGQGGTVPALRISGINVQIVNGLGATNGNPAFPGGVEPQNTATNGLGNRSSSIGTSCFGGENNEAAGMSATVLGGRGNLASGSHSLIAGGESGEASGPVSTVSGGMLNLASGPNSAVFGGGFHVGDRNVASGIYAVILGGRANVAAHLDSTIRGGCSRSTTTDCEAIP